jgi:DNA polymerase-3 subunit delta'
VAHAIADRLLNLPGEAGGLARRNPGEGGHPDCFELRPSGKARQIRIGDPENPEPGTMREFLRKISVSPAIARCKVGIVYEADRMNEFTSNAFLKTLEEPPGLTTLLLLTTRPYALLPTIRSRCLHFRFAASAAPFAHPALPGWKTDYQAWLGRLTDGIIERRAVAEQVFSLYGLVVRFSAIVAGATEAICNAREEKLPPDLSEEEQIAIKTGIANGIRRKLFAEVEHATVMFARPRLATSDGAVRRALTMAVDKLERCNRLLGLNLSESAALEEFLLTSLRLWTKR